MLTKLAILSILMNFATGFLAPTPTCTGCPACQNVNSCGGTGTEETTTESSTDEQSTTLEYYQQYWQSLGWKTDDAGNVFIGDDNSKLQLIQMGSYCPEAICKGWFGIW